ncbi:hypothetical protein Tco_0906180 [Tanacetum coccineum]
MTTLADKAILSSADNRPPMLEKYMYDTLKSRMELYMMNIHGQMILESVKNGPLIWPTIEENGVSRPKKYYELSITKAIQADCDVKATNIILQELPPEATNLHASDLSIRIGFWLALSCIGGTVELHPLSKELLAAICFISPMGILQNKGLTNLRENQQGVLCFLLCVLYDFDACPVPALQLDPPNLRICYY